MLWYQPFCREECIVFLQKSEKNLNMMLFLDRKSLKFLLQLNEFKKLKRILTFYRFYEEMKNVNNV